MAHRALHAVERPDGRYDCYRSRLNGLALFEAGQPAPDRPESDATAAVVDVSADGVLEQVDPRTDEALFVHALDGTVSAYLVCWTGIPSFESVGGERAGATAFVPITDGTEAVRLDRILATAKEVLGDAVDAGLCSRAVAERYLRRFVARHPDVPDGTLWRPGEVI